MVNAIASGFFATNIGGGLPPKYLSFG